MQGYTQDRQLGDNDRLAQAQRGKYIILFIVKDGLGFVLLLLGGLAVKNTQGQTDTFGPPYFIGAFIVGCALVLAGVINVLMFRTTAHRELSNYACGEIGFTVVSVMGGFIGIFFVAIFGVPECNPNNHFSHCNYTKNMSENRNIAKAILVFILVSEIVAIGSIVINCRAYRGLGPYNAFRPRQHYGMTVQQQTYTPAGPTSVAVTTAPEPPRYFDGRHYGGRDAYRRDDFSRDRQVIIGGQVIDKEPGGFSGAILSQPQNVTVIHPPTGYPQYQAGHGTQPGYGAQVYQPSGAVNDLQEQNRLLREQIAIQQQQLAITQQHDNRAPSPGISLPPSYESCLQDPAQINLLQEQNKELQNRYHNQQQRIEKMSPPSDEHREPSAPPM